MIAMTLMFAAARGTKPTESTFLFVATFGQAAVFLSGYPAGMSGTHSGAAVVVVGVRRDPSTALRMTASRGRLKEAV